MKRTVVAFVASWLGIASLAGAQRNASTPVPPSVRELQNLTYAEADGAPRQMDLYQPRDASAASPFIVFVNCGGGGGLPRAGFRSHALYLAERGIAAATTSCLAAPAAGAAPLNDLVAAVRFLRSHASEYRLDVQRAAVGGGSAGGVLSMLAGTNKWDGAGWSQAPKDQRLQAIIVYNAGLTQVLPHISEQMAPTLMLSGTEDVNYPQYAGFLERLHALNVRAELFTAEGVGHGGVNQPPWYDKAIVKVGEFLASTFAPKQ